MIWLGGAPLWRANSKFYALRARILLGWWPRKGAKYLENDILDVVSAEAKSLGLVSGHAAKAVG